MTPQASDRCYRIGKVAERLGVTTRTIRYYEELGLLGSGTDRSKGAHRLYGEADVAHLQEVLRLRDLLDLRCGARVGALRWGDRAGARTALTRAIVSHGDPVDQPVRR